MGGGGQDGRTRGLLPLLLALFAVLMQVNAPVARAAMIASPLSVICHDATGGGQRPTPTRDHQACPACSVCCTAVAVVLTEAPPAVSPPVCRQLAVARPELAARSVRGLPLRAPCARGPPARLA